MRFQSIMRPYGVVPHFPEHTGERVYMEPFTKAGGLPDHLSRWQQVVDQMMAAVDTDQTCYLMIDQGIVSDKALRREGLHIDGYWHGGHHGHRMEAGGHRPGGDDSWRWKSVPEFNRHRSFEEKIGHKPITNPHDDSPEDWSAATFEAPEAILLATDLEGCMAYTGEFYGPIGAGGDCSHVDIGALGLVPHVLRRNRVYAGNVTALHESAPLYSGPRTLVRINTPGWSPS